MEHGDYIKRFVQWAGECEDIRAAFVIGSRVEGRRDGDRWSDTDVLVYTSRPHFYLGRTGWLENMGEVLLTLAPETPGGGELHRRVVFRDGAVFDFLFFSVEQLRALVNDGLYHRSFCRGVQVILDKDGDGEKLVPGEFIPTVLRPPTEDEFLETVNAFWYLALILARQLRRGRHWTVKIKEHAMEVCLLRMVEWHTRTPRGWDFDTWYDGRNIETWAEDWVTGQLEGLFGGYGRKEGQPVLFRRMQVFRRLAEETAAGLGYMYTGDVAERVGGWVEECLKEIS